MLLLWNISFYFSHFVVSLSRRLHCALWLRNNDSVSIFLGSFNKKHSRTFVCTMNSANVIWKYNKLFYFEVNRYERSLLQNMSETIPIESWNGKIVTKLLLNVLTLSKAQNKKKKHWAHRNTNGTELKSCHSIFFFHQFLCFHFHLYFSNVSMFKVYSRLGWLLVRFELKLQTFFTEQTRRMILFGIAPEAVRFHTMICNIISSRRFNWLITLLLLGSWSRWFI